MGKPHPKGIQGEDIAARYLSGKGYDVRERNVHYRGGELDIVAFDPAQKELVFVEVKSRSSRLFGWPEEDVRERKRTRLRLAAGLYLGSHRQYRTAPYRFDIIAIELRETSARVTHYKNVEIR
ncbi:hypothetical protein A3J43_04410 [Candidatus Uhrbacteria bacterium RIFCSPHIGHO2_12_FULL_54_23]|uniref:UPF0102 protein A3J43_04410 n=3 Tax=Candidatus Uhriibacteriota TaxID=1752732 RepID=A0A1F7UHD9_9BACT|nr:MAG: hypothetical protein A3J43_04410 [Candidatus Uhrbacteria bacterium RIFCSPHIGHO2_12_FULL_54_23]OGL83599.1 MAG: hypothetical protein A3B36_02905 [Candidatus Uhrbacteria bacterium RIFCSPLOWO2_01_FULL_55_36]OGL89961.1 MAG: hypothetical protein A3J36_03135 [Candidatus Uhrbacteria bacterium RIFCSPLOWO2_02_FULL_54_37]